MTQDAVVAAGPAPAPTMAQPRTGVRGWLVLGMLFVFYLINYADKAVLGLAAPTVMKELGITATQYGLLSSVFFLVFSVASLAVGFVVDRFRTKPILGIMALTWTVAQALLLAPIPGLLALTLSRVILGAGEGPGFGVTNHAAMKWFPPKNRSIASMGIGLGTPIGTMLAIPALAWFLSGHSWRVTFGALAFLSLVWAIVWAFVGKEGPFVETGRQRSAAPAGAGKWKAYLKVLATPTYLGVLFGGIASYWSTTILLAWVPAYLQSVVGLSPAAVSGVTMLPWLVQALAILLLVGLASTWMVRRGASAKMARGVLSGLAVLLSGLAMVAMAVGRPEGGALVVLLALGFGASAAVVPMSQTVIAEIAPTEIRGGLLGIYTAVFSLTGVVAPALTGVLVDVSATPAAGFQTIFLVSGGMLVLAGLACCFMVDPRRDARRLGLEVM